MAVKFFCKKSIFLLLLIIFALAAISVSEEKLKEAKFYNKRAENTVQCQLCPRRCTLKDGQRGVCRARINKEGTLYTLVYGRPVALHVDPIEKKPFFHVLPSSSSYSIATVGCNMRCIFCQNWQISQGSPGDFDLPYVSPEELVKKALDNNCKTIAYTYTEPTVFYEYMLDIAKLARKKGIKNVVHTCGYINKEPMIELCKYMDAVNVDLKSIEPEFYYELTSGQMPPVLETLKSLKKSGVWIEVTNLVIPTKNDNLETIKKMCLWIKENLGDTVPVHFSRFYPQYQLANLPPTPIDRLEKARQIAEGVGLKFVYIGNVPGSSGENTYCPYCKKILIRRTGYFVTANNIVKGRCKFCQKEIPGIF